MSVDKFNGSKPDEATINEIKKKYPNCLINGYPFPGMFIIYRSYNMDDQEELVRARELKEKELNRGLSETEVESMIVERFVVWPPNFKELLDAKQIPAGLPSMLTSYILVSSGYVELKPEIL